MMADYAEIRKTCEGLLSAAECETLYNTLNFARTLPAFVPDPRGKAAHLGVPGRYARGAMPALDTVRETAPAERPDWIRVRACPDGRCCACGAWGLC